MNFKKQISPYSIIFKLCGLCAVTISNCKNKIDLILIFAVLINIIILFTGMYVVYLHEHLIFYSENAIGKFTDIIELSAPILAHIMANFETLFTRKHQTKIWENILETEIILRNSVNKNSSQARNYAFKFLNLNLLSVLSEVLIIIIIWKDLRWSRLWYARLFSNIVGRLIILQAIFYIEFIRNQISIINFELGEIYKITNLMYTEKNMFNEKYRISVFRKLKKLKKLHSKMWYTTQRVNSRFGWSILAAVINYFICLTVDFYWIYVHHGSACKYTIEVILNKITEIVLLPASVLCAIAPVLCVYYIFASCDSFMKEANYLPVPLHKIRAKLHDKNINKLVIIYFFNFFFFNKNDY